ncbi:MAG TPA: hypothetical protein VKV24_15645 [Casimicrobiaceae bacterium]|nr:hypothetical protein [Casimicrobiaceae bacterium]
MNAYEPRTPRTLLGFAAIAMTAGTLALSVLWPAESPQATAQQDLATRIESERCVPDSGTLVSGIDVVAVRSTHVAPIAQWHVPHWSRG